MNAEGTAVTTNDYFCIRIGFSGNPDPDPAFNSSGIQIQGAKPMRIHKDPRPWIHPDPGQTLPVTKRCLRYRYLDSNPESFRTATARRASNLAMLMLISILYLSVVNHCLFLSSLSQSLVPTLGDTADLVKSKGKSVHSLGLRKT